MSLTNPLTLARGAVLALALVAVAGWAQKPSPVLPGEAAAVKKLI